MKKTFALFLFLLFGGIFLTATLQHSLLAQKDQVTFLDEIKYGDSSVVEGMTATIRAGYDEQLFWTTDYIFGKTPTIHTDYRIYSTRQEERPDMDNDFYMDIDFGQPTQYSDEDLSSPLTGIQKAFQELSASTGPNETKRKKIDLSDYYDYYPLTFSLCFNGYSEYYAWDREATSENEPSANYEFLRDYFKIPVHEGDTRILEISKENGAISYSSLDYDDTTDPYYLGIYQTEADNGIYFTLDLAQSTDHEGLDSSQIAGGYGIYCIPIDRQAATAEEQISVTDLSMIYPLDPAVQILSLSTTKDQSQLILSCLETDQPAGSERMTLLFIDTKTHETVQTLYIDAIPQADGSSEVLIPYDFYCYDDFIVLSCSGSYLVVLDQSEENHYEFSFVTDVYENPVFSNYLDNPDSMGFDWNGQLLALIGNETGQLADHYLYPTCGFYVAVFDSDGLVYYSTHNSSLGRGEYPVSSNSLSLLTRRQEPALELHWNSSN